MERVLAELQKRAPCDSGKKDEQIIDLCRIEQQQQQKKVERERGQHRVVALVLYQCCPGASSSLDPRYFS